MTSAMQRGGPTAQSSMLAAQQGGVWEWQYPFFWLVGFVEWIFAYVLETGLWSLTVSVPPLSRRL